MVNKFYKLGMFHALQRKKEKSMKDHKLHLLTWETTLTCNMACKHCFNNSLEQKYSNELTTEEIKKALTQIAEDFDASKMTLAITGGEPLLRADLFEVMKYATQELGFNRGIATNGLLLNEENINKLKDANLKTIAISLDGIGVIHDEFRDVPGIFPIVIEHIKQIKKADFLSHLQISTTIYKGNLHQLDEMYELVSELGVDSWKLGAVDPVGRAKDNPDLLLDSVEMKMLLDFVKAKRKEKKLKVTRNSQGYLGMDYEMEVRDGCFNCVSGINVASILYNGDIFGCYSMPKNPNFVQGNVKTERFSEVRNNKFQAFRSMNRLENDTCKNCGEWDFCQGGSMHTFDFDKKCQGKCPFEMICKSKNVR